MSWAAQVMAHLRPVREAAAEQLAELTREEIVSVMRDATPTGYTDDGGYTSSAPGEPPAYGRGRYAASWKASSARSNGSRSEASAFSAMRDRRTGRLVGAALEWGDEDTEARPHIRVAIDRIRPRVTALLLRISR